MSERPVNRPSDRPAERPTDGGTFPQDRYRNPETALGGADSVEKTTYVTGAGTEPEARIPEDPGRRKGEGGRTVPTAPAGGGQRTVWAIVGLLVIGAVLVYLLGYGR
jgi:hypothetical protein